MPLAGEYSNDEEGDYLHRSSAEALDYLQHHAQVEF